MSIRSQHPHLLKTAFFVLTAAILNLSSVQAEEKSRIGTVRITHLLDNYYKTKEAKKIDIARQKDIAKDNQQRQEAIVAIGAELKKLEAEIKDPSLSPEKRKSLLPTAQEKHQSLQSLERERQEFISRKKKQIAEANAATMDQLRGEVYKAVNEVGASAEVDLIFDESGLTAQSGMPFLLYQRSPVDLTNLVLEALNKDAPVTTEEKPAEGQ